MVFSRNLVSETGVHADVVQNIRASLSRIDETEAAVEAFEEEPDRATRLSLTRTAAPGPLRGATLGVKDIFAVEGLLTRGGSSLDPGEFSSPEASAVTALRRAGATVIGKTKTTEFAGPHATTTRNPHDLRHTPGGSSSGSAAAVAAGSVSLAIGTQTIGSVIRPASYCGVAGFKSTQGSIPLDGVIPCAQSYDSVGLFATAVSDVMLAASVFFDNEPPMDRKPVIAIPAPEYLDLADRTTLEVFRSVVRDLTESDLDVPETSFAADIDKLSGTQSVIHDFEFSQAHRDRFRRHASLLGSATVEVIRRGFRIPEREYTAASKELAEQRSAFDTRMDQEGFDLVIAPAATDVAPLGLSYTGDPAMSLPWSHLGLPCVTIPLPRDSGELPLGLQLVGRRHMDMPLLRWASEVAAVITQRKLIT